MEEILKKVTEESRILQKSNTKLGEEVQSAREDNDCYEEAYIRALEENIILNRRVNKKEWVRRIYDSLMHFN